MIFTIILLALTGLNLYKDFSRDKGEHRKAKITQAVVVWYMVLMYASSITFVGYLVRHFAEFNERFNVPIGVLPSSVVRPGILIHTVLCVVLIFTAFSLARRKQRAVKLFRVVLLLSIPTEVIAFYRGFESEASGLPAWLVLSAGFLAMGMINLTIYVLYGKPYMRDFFRGPVPLDLSALDVGGGAGTGFGGKA